MNQRSNNLAWAGLAFGAWLAFLLTLAAINYFAEADWAAPELMGGAFLASIPNLLLFAFQWRKCRQQIRAVLVLQRQSATEEIV